MKSFFYSTLGRRKILWVILLAFALRITFLGSESLWYDEIVTIDDSMESIPEIIGDRWDPHPPLYYLILHYWLKLGDSEFMARLPSVVIGTFSILAIFYMTRQLLDEEKALITALIVAVAPLHIWYSQEARMYILVSLWGILSILFLSRWLTSGKRATLFLYIFFTVLGIYTHYVMLVLFVLENVYVFALLVGKHNFSNIASLRSWLGAQVLILITYLPWLPVFLEHWSLIRGATNYPIWIFSTTPVILILAFISTVALVALTIWFRIGSPVQFVKAGRYLRLLFLATFIVYAAFLVISMTNRLTTFKRHSFIFFPFLVIVCVALLSTITHAHWRRWLIVIAAISLAVVLFNGFALQKPPWRQVVDQIEEQASIDDGVILVPSWMAPTFKYYANNNLPLITLTPDNLESQASDLESDYERVWVVTNKKHIRWAGSQEQISTWFAVNHQPLFVSEQGELQISLFDLESKNESAN